MSGVCTEGGAPKQCGIASTVHEQKQQMLLPCSRPVLRAPCPPQAVEGSSRDPRCQQKFARAPLIFPKLGVGVAFGSPAVRRQPLRRQPCVTSLAMPALR